MCFNRFQLIAMTVFLCVFLGNVLYMVTAKHINPIVLGLRKKGLQRILELSWYAVMALWTAEVLIYSLNLDFQPLPPVFDTVILNSVAVRLLGVFLIVFGIALFIGALISFGSSWRVGIDDKTHGKLVTSGVFAMSRNPIYIFIDAYFFGTFLINGTLIFLLFSILTVLGMHYQIIQEEKSLQITYGEAYRDYCSKTPRYIGRPQ